MTLDELSDYFDQLADEIGEAMQKDIPIIVGVEAVNFFKQGFEDEGFTDKSFERWAEVKRRMGQGKGADAVRKILTGRTGNLKDSIDYDVEPWKVIVYANPQNVGAGENYAATHNFGGVVNGVFVPQRQFIGHSEQLNDKIKEKIENYLNQKISQHE